MKIIFRDYRPADKEMVRECIEGIHDYLIAIDPFSLIRRATGFGQHIVEKTMENVARFQGKIIFAESEGNVCGMIVGFLIEQSPEDLLECAPMKAGKIKELFVAEGWRGQGIGRALVERMEEYFRELGCDRVFVHCFGPNKGARECYKKLGFEEWGVDHVKRL